MKAMESKLLDTKTEMDTLDMLHEIRTLNAKNSTVDPLDIIEHVRSYFGYTNKMSLLPKMRYNLSRKMRKLP
jgi:hypothetical protein